MIWSADNKSLKSGFARFLPFYLRFLVFPLLFYPLFSSVALSQDGDIVDNLKAKIAKNRDDYESHLAIASIYFDRGLYEEAASFMNEDFENELGYGWLMAKIELGRENFAKAIAMSEKALRENPNDFSMFMLRGDSYRAMKDNEKARSSYLRASQCEPHNMRPLWLIAQLSTNEIDEIAWLWQITERADRDEKALAFERLATKDMEAGKYSSALEIVERGLKNLSTPKLEIIRAKVLMGQFLFDQALEAVEKAALSGESKELAEIRLEIDKSKKKLDDERIGREKNADNHQPEHDSFRESGPVPGQEWPFAEGQKDGAMEGKSGDSKSILPHGQKKALNQNGESSKKKSGLSFYFAGAVIALSLALFGFAFFKLYEKWKKQRPIRFGAKGDWARVAEISNEGEDNLELLALYMKAHEIKGDFKKAMVFARKWVNISGESGESLEALIRLAIKGNLLKDAALAHKRLAEKDIDKGENLLRYAELSLQCGDQEGVTEGVKSLAEFDPKTARELLEKLLERSPENLEALYALARLEGRNGYLKEALIRTEKLVDIKPDSIRFLKLLADLYMETERQENALEIFKIILRLAPGEVEIRKRLTNLYLVMDDPHHALAQYTHLIREAGDTSEVIRSLEKKLGEGDSDGDILASMAGVCAIGGDFPRALHLIRKAVEAEPENLEIRIRLAKAYEDIGEWDQAATVYSQILSKEPQIAELWLSMGNCLGRCGQNKEALEAMKKCLEKDPNRADQVISALTSLVAKNPEDTELHSELANLHQKKQDLQKVAEEYLAIHKKKPQDLEIMGKLGSAYMALGKNVEAIEIYEKLRELQPDQGSCLYSLARLYFIVGDPDKVIGLAEEIIENHPAEIKKIGHLLKKLIEVNPEKFEARIPLSKIYKIAGRRDKEARELEVVFDNMPDNKEIIFPLVSAYNALDKPESSTEILRSLYRNNKDDLQVMGKLVESYISQERLSEGITLIEDAMENNLASLDIVEKMTRNILINRPGNTSLMKILAKILMKKANYQGAVEILTDSLKQSPDDLESLKLMMKASEKSGDDRLCIACARRYIRNNPKDWNSYRVMANALFRIKEPDKAIAAFEKLVELNPNDLDIRVELADIYLKNNDYEKAVAHFNLLCQMAPGDIRIARKQRYAEEKMLGDRITRYKMRLKYEGENQSTLLKLGIALYQLGEYDEAIVNLQMVHQQDLLTHSRFYQGAAFMQQGLYDAAEKLLAALDFSSMSKETKLDLEYRLGRLYEANEFFKKALEIYQGIIAEDIGYSDVRARIEKIRREDMGDSQLQSLTLSQELTQKYERFNLMRIGGMGRIYKAFDPENDRTVAIKVIADRYRENKVALQRFIERDGELVMGLKHPHIVQVYDIGRGELPYIVLEFIDGVSLQRIIDESAPIPYARMLKIMDGVISAIALAHERGIVHRDIKPDNIMIMQNDYPKVLDFGLARLTKAETVTRSDAMIGTVHYMPPEQLRGPAKEPTCDVYSIGVTIFEILTGQLPFSGDVEQIMYQIFNEMPPQISSFVLVPLWLESLVHRCMAKEPSARPENAGAILREIQAGLKSEREKAHG